jgi:hypothetical protein
MALAGGKGGERGLLGSEENIAKGRSGCQKEVLRVLFRTCPWDGRVDGRALHKYGLYFTGTDTD